MTISMLKTAKMGSRPLSQGHTQSVSRLSRLALRLLSQIDVKSAIEAVQRVEQMTSRSRNLVKETLSNVSTAEYRVANNGIKDFTFSFVENVVTGMMELGVLDKPLNQISNRWSQSYTFIQVQIEMIVNDPGFIVPVAAFVKECMISPVQRELAQETSVTKEIPSPPGHSPWASAGSTLYKEFEAIRPCREQNDRKAQRKHGSLVESRDKERKIRQSLSSLFQSDDSLKIPTSTSSGLSSRFFSKSSDSNRCKCSSRRKAKNIAVIHTAKYCSKKAFDYRTY